MTAPLYHGHLVVFVDGYKYVDKYAVHHVVHEGKTYSIPDRLMPPEVHEIDTQDWWTTGWAVGDNACDRLCSRLGAKPLKKFYDFDEAVRFIEIRQRKAKRLQFVLVYLTKDRLGKDRRDVVRSSDDIRLINIRNANELANHANFIAQQQAERRAKYPELEALEARFGYSKALALADFLASLREDGKDQVLSSMSKATFYRYRRKLAAVGIALPE